MSAPFKMDETTTLMLNFSEMTLATPFYPGSTSEKDMPSYPAQCFRHYSHYVVTVFGVISNVIALVVLGFSRRMRRSASGVFLIALAVTDTLVLLTTMVGHLMRGQSALNNNSKSCPSAREMILANRATCSIVFYMKYSVRCLATLVVLLISWHRLMVVGFPLNQKIKTLTSVKSVSIQLVACTILSLIASSYATSFMPDDVGCSPMQKNIYDLGVTIVDVVFCDIIASVLILVFSLWTVVIFVRAGNRLLQRQDSGTSAARKKGERHMTVLLITVALTFIALRLPYTIIWLPHWFGQSYSPTLQSANYVTEVFSLLNHAIHLYLYCICSHGFRQEMKMVFTKRSGQFYSSSMRKRSITLTSSIRLNNLQVTNSTTSSSAPREEANAVIKQ